MGHSFAIERAIRLAIRAHEGQMRKGQPSVPYLVHPLQVGMLLHRHAFAESIVIAGILHDVIEDTPVDVAQVRREFGDDVAHYLLEVTEDKSRSWVERKRHTIESIAVMSEGALAITASDKLHNLADIARLEEERGEAAWAVFSKGKAQTLEYYRRVGGQLELHFPHPLTSDLLEILARWERH